MPQKVMIHRNKTRTRLFWIIIVLALALSVQQISATPRTARVGKLLINEFVAANGSGLTDEDGDHSDWIEIYNPGSQPVNLSGWSLSNDPDQPVKWPFPDITIKPQEYLVVFASGKNRRGAEPGAALHTNFRLGKEGIFLGLHNVLESAFVDAISPRYPVQLRDIAYGRYGEARAFGYLAIPTPGGPNSDAHVWDNIAPTVAFSVERGFYETPFTVSLSSSDPEATIRYTLDGSPPTGSHGALYEEPIAIDRTSTLRAIASRSGALPSPVETHTYIFLEDTLNQPDQPAGFPSSWDTQLIQEQGVTKVAPVPPDYEMAPDIVGDPQYREPLIEGLHSLPVVSLVMEMPSFAQLHAHSHDTGRTTEQPVSMEFFDPAQNSTGVQVDAGLQLHHPQAQADLATKHSFRLFFRGDYGATRLTYPLFPDSPMQEFDTLMLQAGTDSGFSQPNAALKQASYLRDEWLRRSQLTMSGLGVHGQFVHVYVNGLYWGVYDLIEVPDEAFAASYLGGKEEDWFLADPEGPLSERRENQKHKLHQLFTILGFPPALNEKFEAQDYLVDTYTSVASHIDPIQFSDYMILDWYTEAQGWPKNSWHAAVRLEDLPGQGKFLIANGVIEPASDHEGHEHPPNIVDTLFETMRQNPDFRVQLADRMYAHLFNDGALTDGHSQSRWQEIERQIEQAMVGESARWGDANRASSLTVEDWRSASQATLDQMEGTAAEIVAMAREAGYYPPFDPPRLSHPGGVVEAAFELALTLPDSAGGGAIYYTLDGTDPRLPVTGEPSPIATVYQAPIALSYNTQLKARIYKDDTWSALQEATFRVVPQDFKLRITEVMYNPTGGDGYEFIELKNTGNTPVNLANLYLDEGVRFIFPPNTPPLGPGQFAVLVSDAAAFAGRYPGVTPAGIYEGQLSNKGERLSLKDAAGQTLLEFSYNDENGWPLTPDGRGDSLRLVDPDLDPNDPKSWKASTDLYGSPGAD